MASVTPLRRQYLDLKRAHEDAILFFRLGDFYEMFGDDARVASEVLQIVLTSREMGKGVRVPMCGVPHHAVETYAARLIEAGHKVAICDQVGVPGAGLVERRVTQVITPGTVVEDGMLAPDRNNYLVAVAVLDEDVGLAYADITSGEFAAASYGGKGGLAAAARELDRLAPAELLLPEAALGLASVPARVTPAERWSAAPKAAFEALALHLGPSAEAAALAPAAACAAATILNYLEANQPSARHVLTGIHSFPAGEFMEIDEFTMRNLEIFPEGRSWRTGASLLAAIDRTATPMGARLLRRRLSLPLLDTAAIERRLDEVGWLARDGALPA